MPGADAPGFVVGIERVQSTPPKGTGETLEQRPGQGPQGAVECWIVSASRATWLELAGADGGGVEAVAWVRP